MISAKGARARTPITMTSTTGFAVPSFPADLVIGEVAGTGATAACAKIVSAEIKMVIRLEKKRFAAGPQQSEKLNRKSFVRNISFNPAFARNVLKFVQMSPFCLRFAIFRVGQRLLRPPRPPALKLAARRFQM